MPGPGRYRNDDNQDLLMRIRDLEARLSKLERLPQLPQSAVDTGTLTVKGGTVDVLNADESIAIRVTRGGTSNPQIFFYPPGLDPNDTNVRMVGFTTVSAFDASSNPAIAIYVQDQASGDVYGGKVQLDREYAVLSHQPAHISQNEAFIGLGRRALDGRYATIYLQGTFNHSLFGNNQDALNVGSFATGGGFSSFAWTYGITYQNSMIPVVTLLDAAATVPWNLQAFNNAGFTVAWGTNTTTKTINFWAFRAA